MNDAKPLQPSTHRLTLPVSQYRYLFLDGPFPMTPWEYDRMMPLLTVMRPGIVQETDPAGADTPGEES